MTAPRIAIPVPTAADHEYNRRSWRQYADAVSQSGGVAVEIPLGDAPAATAKLIASCQAILLPGSPADVNPQKYGQAAEPETNAADAARENVDELLLQDAHNLRKPIFGICFGTQMLNVWRGGTLVQHLMPMPVNHAAGAAVAVAHTAVVAPGSLLGAIAGEAAPLAKKDAAAPGMGIPINSSHHQAIGIPGDGLRVTARSPHDGVVEAVEATAPGGFLIGVQWHPERTYSTDAVSRGLFDRFVAAARVWQPLAPTVPAREG
jgi:putative glutamine amidotransferase